jgi:hypothetical protein
MIKEDLIERAEQGDLAALVQLDASGLLLGADETLAQYATRLRCLKRNSERMDGELRRQQSYTVDDITVQAHWRIPSELFAEAHDDTERLYGFRLEWVSGFFIDPRFSLLFGGCAFYFFPDFFALFIIRRAFAKRSRWLIYSRRELLAHELCHVARIALGSQRYEEVFAYQTSASAFRRLAGSIFRGQAEALWLLGSTLGLLLAQALRTLVWPWWPVWPFWGLVLGVVLWLTMHLALLRRTWMRALRQAESALPGQGLRMLFRCTDLEVDELAELGSVEAARRWLDDHCGAEIRWRVTAARCAEPASPQSP